MLFFLLNMVSFNKDDIAVIFIDLLLWSSRNSKHVSDSTVADGKNETESASLIYVHFADLLPSLLLPILDLNWINKCNNIASDTELENQLLAVSE